MPATTPSPQSPPPPEAPAPAPSDAAAAGAPSAEAPPAPRSYLPPDDPGLPVPRVPRKQVRGRLLEAAARVFAEHGYERSRLTDIARAAGFTKGAVYSNFASKHELFAELLTEHAKSTTTGILEDLPPSTDLCEVAPRAAELMAHWLVHEAGWHQLELEFAASAGRDQDVRGVYAPRRSAQRAELASVLEIYAERLDITLTADLDQVALILLTLHNGLGLEHGADPETVTGPVMERAIATVLNGLIRVHGDCAGQGGTQ